VDDRLKAIAQQSRQTPEQVRQHYEKQKWIDKLKGQLLYEKTLDLLVSKANVKEVKAKKGDIPKAEPSKKMEKTAAQKATKAKKK